MLTDFLGQEIKLDSYVVYATRHGSSMNMNIGKVLDITSDEKTRWGRDGVVTEYRLKVQPLAESNWGTDDKGIPRPARPRNYDKAVWLSALERVMVIGKHTAAYIYEDLDYSP